MITTIKGTSHSGKTTKLLEFMIKNKTGVLFQNEMTTEYLNDRINQLNSENKELNILVENSDVTDNIDLLSKINDYISKGYKDFYIDSLNLFYNERGYPYHCLKEELMNIILETGVNLTYSEQLKRSYYEREPKLIITQTTKIEG